ncbi:MAG: type II secretion system F family protein [Minisyncoccia bacterium]
MKFFKFNSIDTSGKTQKGTLLANTEEEVIEYLSSLGLTVLKISPVKENIFSKLSKSIFKISLKNKIFLARTISLILKSGASPVEGLKNFVKDLKGGKLKEFILFLILNVEKGNPIYQAFQAFPEDFSQIEVEMIKVGEMSGNLLKTFEDWTENLEKEKEIRSEILSSLIYPTIVLIAAFAVVILASTLVMPRLSQLVLEMGTKLPKFSEIILKVGIFIGKNIKSILLILGALILILIFLIISKRGRDFFYKLGLKIPFIKNLLFSLNLRAFCFTLSSLIEGGIPLAQSLYLTSSVIKHEGIRTALTRIYKKIQTGGDFGELISEEPIFPKIFSGIIKTASQTGNLSEILRILEKNYEEEIRILIKNLITIIEPVLILGVGIIVGFVAVSVIVPIYQQISSQLEQSMKGPGELMK